VEPADLLPPLEPLGHSNDLPADLADAVASVVSAADTMGARDGQG
jgi:hypothetical protein